MQKGVLKGNSESEFVYKRPLAFFLFNGANSFVWKTDTNKQYICMSRYLL